MILYDGIIFALQSRGGISVLFSELLQRLDTRRLNFTLLRYDQGESPAVRNGRILRCVPRLMERYRRCDTGTLRPRLFHSTYYRLPTQSEYIVTTVHDFTYERFVNGPRRLVHSSQKKAAIRRADKIICVSRSTRDDLLEHVPGISEDRIVVVPNGVADDYRVLEGEAARTRDFALFVGTRGGYKNFIAAIEGVARISGLRLVCVGGGPFTQAEHRLLETYLAGRYTHVGFISNIRLNELYNQAFCLLYPSRYEGFGIPILEAMRAGCPVVAVAASSVPEVTGDAALLMEEGTAEEIAIALELLQDGALRNDMVAAGLRQAGQFCWDRTFAETLGVYRELLGNDVPQHA